MSTVNVYFLGGAGALISRFLPAQLPDFCAQPNIYYLDTSESEVAYHRHGAKFTLFSEQNVKSGSGGIRASKVEVVKTHLPAFVASNHHADTNILVFSISGASGSILAHSIAASMLANGKKVIILLSSSPTTLVRASNAQKVILGFKQLARKYANSIIGYMYEAPSSGFEATDKYLVQDLTVLLHFLSGNLRSIDESDVEVMLSPEKLPDANIEPDLYSMNIIFGKQHPGNESPLTIMTLSPTGATDDIGSGAAMIYSGEIDPGALSHFVGQESEPYISLAIYNSDVVNWINQLSKRIDQLKSKSDAMRQAKVELPKTVNYTANDDGLFL